MPHVINILFWINTAEMWFCVAAIFSCALPIVQFAPICPNVMMMLLFSGAQWWLFPSAFRPDAIFVNMLKIFDFSNFFLPFSNSIIHLYNNNRFDDLQQFRIYIVKFLGASPVPIFFHFHAIFDKIWPNNKLDPPLIRTQKVTLIS